MPGMLWMKTNLDQLRSFSVWLAANLDWLLGFLNTLGAETRPSLSWCCELGLGSNLIGFRLNTRKRNKVWHISVLLYQNQTGVSAQVKLDLDLIFKKSWKNTSLEKNIFFLLSTHQPSSLFYWSLPPIRQCHFIWTFFKAPLTKFWFRFHIAKH